MIQRVGPLKDHLANEGHTLQRMQTLNWVTAIDSLSFTYNNEVKMALRMVTNVPITTSNSASANDSLALMQAV